MRMDNETFRLRVENLFAAVRKDDNGTLDDGVMAELSRLARAPRKARHFLKVVSEHEGADLQEHFYRLIFGGAKGEADTSDLERHVRHMFYEDREHAKSMLARIATSDVLPALFRVIVATEEGWLAGEMIRIVLSAPPEELAEPIHDALYSEDYLIQCLAIYLVGKSGDDRLLDLLAGFYRKPVGEKLDRLEQKSADALIEGMEKASDGLFVKWTKDKSSRIRELGLSAVSSRRLVGAVGDLLGLILVDPRTRASAAQTLLQFESEGLLTLSPGNDGVAPIERIVQSAKQEPLQATLRSLMRDDSAAVREAAVKTTLFLSDPKALSSTLRRLAIEDRSTSVRIAALHALTASDHDRLIPVLVEVLTDTKAGASGEEVAQTALTIVKQHLNDAETKEVQDGVRAKKQQRDAALDLFTSEVEGWRHDI